MKQLLHPYQSQAIAGARAQCTKNPIIVAPTGAGKTTIAAHIVLGAVERGKRVLFLAHRKELIDQAAVRFAGHGASVGIIKAGIHPDESCPVQVASVQTLIRRKPPQSDIVIIDECHHASAETYQTILSWYPNSIRIGLTATPFRTDGSGLGDAGFGAIVVAATPKKLIAEGYYLEPIVFAGVPIEGLDNLKVIAGDYQRSGLSLLMTQSKLLGNIVDAWKEHAEGRPTVCFAASVEHSQRIVEAFGDIARHIDGTTPEDVREDILRSFERGEIKIVSNYGILTEGWDVPAASVAILARPTKSLGLYMQMAGRIVRPMPGKAQPIILDHGELTERHGFVTQDLVFSLEGKLKSKRESFKNCPKCFLLLKSGETCPNCGTPLSKPREVATLGEGKMRLLTEADLKKEFFRKKLIDAACYGNKVGWARMKFKEKFGHWPQLYALEREHYQPFGKPITLDHLNDISGDVEEVFEVVHSEPPSSDWGKLAACAAYLKRAERERGSNQSGNPPGSLWS